MASARGWCSGIRESEGRAKGVRVDVTEAAEEGRGGGGGGCGCGKGALLMCGGGEATDAVTLFVSDVLAGTEDDERDNNDDDLNTEPIAENSDVDGNDDAIIVLPLEPIVVAGVALISLLLPCPDGAAAAFTAAARSGSELSAVA